MASTKDTEKPEEVTHAASEESAIVSLPVTQRETNVANAPKKPANTQTIITLAIVTSVVLFFLGLGLGYMLGHAGTSSRTMPGNGTMQPPPNGGGRRSMPNSGTDDTTDNSKSDTKTQTN